MRFFFLLLFSLSFLSANIKLQGLYRNNKEVKRFINYMIRVHNFKRDYLITTFNKAAKPKAFKIKRRKRKVVCGYACGVKWWLKSVGFSRYEKIYLNQDRVIEGAKFLRRYKTIFNRIEKKLKVDKYIIAAIIGIETYYGEYKGSWETFNTLAYRAFKQKNRKRYFKYELANLLLLAYRQHLNALYLKGSKYGALGLGQLMPHSYLQYGLSFDGNKRVEPFSNPDAIATIANFLHKKGWQFHKPIAIRAKYKGRFFKKTFNPKRAYSLSYLKKIGLTPRQKTKAKYAYVIKLHRAEFDEVWLAFHNFKVLKHYNNSNNYAMAVYLLAQAIKNYYQKHYK